MSPLNIKVVWVGSDAVERLNILEKGDCDLVHLSLGGGS
jgi:hypothetical protein